MYIGGLQETVGNLVAKNLNPLMLYCATEGESGADEYIYNIHI